MLKIILRTLIIYIFLLIVMRLMGKRQLGELELSELITTFLFSEIATTPITNPDSSIWHAILPIIIIASLEMLLSFSLLKIPILKKILTGRPSVIIQRGKISKEEMKRARLTIDELISQIRQGGIFNISEVEYAILEENGKLTVVPKCKNRPPDTETMGLCVPERGVMHIIISDGKINNKNLDTVKKNTDWLNKALKSYNLSVDDVFLMTVNDGGSIFIQSQDGQIISKN